MKTILVDAVHCFIVEKEGVFVMSTDMHGLLERYENKKIILSGANDEQLVKFGLDNVPYEVFTLKHHPEKMDPEYYKLLLSKFNLNVSEVIYFEHDMAAVKSAQSIGINTYYYDNDKKDLVSLEKFISNNLK